jgi:hypothetical protein
MRLTSWSAQETASLRLVAELAEGLGQQQQQALGHLSSNGCRSSPAAGNYNGGRRGSQKTAISM